MIGGRTSAHSAGSIVDGDTWPPRGLADCGYYGKYADRVAVTPVVGNSLGNYLHQAESRAVRLLTEAHGRRGPQVPQPQPHPYFQGCDVTVMTS